MIVVKEDKRNKKTFITLSKLPDRTQRFLSGALHQIGKENVVEMRKRIRSKDKTGRLYTIAGRHHRASSPGQFPASRSGTLARTVKYKVRGVSQVEFGDTVPYGVFLEEGTKNMAPRPHIEKTVKLKERDTYNALLDVQEQATK
jgi:hypothetical protein